MKKIIYFIAALIITSGLLTACTKEEIKPISPGGGTGIDIRE
jgi:hypothetical protein